MKIQGVRNQTFKGYDARPLKAVYMQKKSCINGQDDIYDELYGIGQDAGFDVIMDYADDKIVKNPNDLIRDPFECSSHKSCWAQDNKIFINSEGKTAVVYPKISRGAENKSAKKLAKKLDVDAKESLVDFEGGNIFLGTKDNGEKYVFVGSDTILKQISKAPRENACAKRAISDHINGIPIEESDRGERKKILKTIEKLAKDFDVKKENVFILKQPSFHLDMAIRPLKYPYVLVNDFQETDKVVQQIGLINYSLYDYNEYKSGQKMSSYEAGREISRELEQYGFKPIRIAGAYTNGINFMNAIVHEKDDGTLCYITNSSKGKNKYYDALQDEFEKEVKEKCDAIKDVRFVSGMGKTDTNFIADILEYLAGGIHCLVTEEPNFDKIV